MILRWVLQGVALYVVGVVVLSILFFQSAWAFTEGWFSGGTPSVETVAEMDSADCVKSSFKVAVLPSKSEPVSLIDREGCVVKGKSLDVAYSDYQAYIRFHSEEVFSSFDDGVGSKLIPGTDTLLRLELRPGATIKNKLAHYKNLTDSLIGGASNPELYVVDYMLDTSKAKYLATYIEPSDGSEVIKSVHRYGFSPNGRYVVAYADYLDVVLIDTTNYTQKVIAKVPSGMYLLPKHILFTVSDDGKYVYEMSSNSFLYQTINCGDDYMGPNVNTTLEKPCPVSAELIYATIDHLSYEPIASDVTFLEGHSVLELTASPPFGVQGPIKKIKIKMPGYIPGIEHKLDYLALGDSYSSGEGDAGRTQNGQTYYLTGTEAEGQCHISSRSYPFVVSQLSNIVSGRTQSVACSGAQVTKDYFRDGQTYMGQGNKLRGMSDDDINTQRSAALANFRPGIVKQVDFVNANKPKVVTLTGGGNDVGFGKIMTYCAHIIYEKKFSGTCDYAKKGSKLHGVLANSIKGQYDHTLNLIDSIKAASPKTSVYVVGYPSFVASKFGCINDAALNRSEIQMLDESILYMNQILESAARFKGVHYIDVYDSFVGGRICEGGMYVTGPESLLHGAKLQEVFHPNASGNARLAEVIMSSGFTLAANNNPLEDRAVSVPSMPNYFAGSASVATRHEQLIANPKVKRGQAVVMTTEKSVFRASSKVTATLYSQPVKVGSYFTASDGSLNETIVIPANAASGLHVLLVEGIGSNGEPISIYQFLEVSNLGSNDLDGDGIKNDTDLCPYIKVWYDESTKQDVCNSDTVKSSFKEGLGVGHQRHEDKNSGVGHWRDSDWLIGQP